MKRSLGHLIDCQIARFAILDLQLLRAMISQMIKHKAVITLKSTIGNQTIGNALVECVPNFSEGRKTETVERLAQAIQSVELPACSTRTSIPITTVQSSPLSPRRR